MGLLSVGRLGATDYGQTEGDAVMAILGSLKDNTVPIVIGLVTLSLVLSWVRWANRTARRRF